jgi:hypothetical protein
MHILRQEYAAASLRRGCEDDGIPYEEFVRRRELDRRLQDISRRLGHVQVRTPLQYTMARFLRGSTSLADQYVEQLTESLHGDHHLRGIERLRYLQRAPLHGLAIYPFGIGEYVCIERNSHSSRS